MDLGEFLAFRRFFAPVAIQVVFWLGVIFVVASALVFMFTHGVAGFFIGIFGLVLGIVMVRIYCELLILLFRIYDELVALRTGRPPMDVGFEVQPLRPNGGVGMATPTSVVDTGPVLPASVPSGIAPIPPH